MKSVTSRSSLCCAGIAAAIAIVIATRQSPPPNEIQLVGSAKSPAQVRLSAFPTQPTRPDHRAKPVLSALPEPSEGANAITTILGDQSLPARDKALALLQAIPQLPDELRGDACEHALVRLDNASYHPAFELLTAENTDATLREMIMDDLAGRSDFLKLPYLVHLASLSDHPYCQEAQVELVAAVGDDYGTNWSGWSDAVATLLESRSGVAGAELLQ